MAKSQKPKLVDAEVVDVQEPKVVQVGDNEIEIQTGKTTIAPKKDDSK